MADRIVSQHPVLAKRLARHWSQAELAKRAGISRAAVSAIESERLSPSVTAALALADVFECLVEDLFRRGPRPEPGAPEWAWEPDFQPGRYWQATVGERTLLYPVEAQWMNPVPHDGVWAEGVFRATQSAREEETLVIATCDPGAGLLAAEYSRLTGYRALIFPRSGLRALELMGKGLVHIAALHRSTLEDPGRNADTVRKQLGASYQLLRMAEWEEGLAVRPDSRFLSAASVVRQSRSWAAREAGSGARECLDELLHGRPFTGREVGGHVSVAEAIRSGWADAGVCVRLCAEEARLKFLPIRKESVDFCFPTGLRHDVRVRGLIRLLRTRSYVRLLSELPGYDARHSGALAKV